jgi:hypothetical protein
MSISNARKRGIPMMTKRVRQIAVFAATTGAVLIGGAGIANAATGHATADASRALHAQPGELAAPLSCGGIATAGPFGSWGPVSDSNCGYFGSPGATLTISFSVNDTDTTPFVCVQSYSYSEKQWVTVGCSDSTGRGTIPWGDVDATPEVRAQSNGTGVGVQWTTG